MDPHQKPTTTTITTPQAFAHQHLHILPLSCSSPLRIPPATYCYTFQAAMRVWHRGHHRYPPPPAVVVRTTDGQCAFLDTRDDHRYRQIVTAALQRSPPHHPILVETHVYPQTVREGRRMCGRMFRWVEHEDNDSGNERTVQPTGVLEEGLWRKEVGDVRWVPRWTPSARAETGADATYASIGQACAQLVRANGMCTGGDPSCRRVEMGVCWVGRVKMGGVGAGGGTTGIGWIVHVARRMEC